MVQCKHDFMLKDKQKMNLPGAIISAETMTEKDVDDVLSLVSKIMWVKLFITFALHS